jgi:hypothetical protein
MAWNLSLVADEIAAALERAEAELRLAQAVAGLDDLDEIALQDIVAAGLSARHEVAREAHYPSTAGRKLTHRPRCDLVLSPKGRPLRPAHEPEGLFTAELCPPEEALWLEVKRARQFGEGGLPHAGYGWQWKTALVADLRKMDGEPLIRAAALAAIVFTASREILEKDLALFERVMASENVLAGPVQARTFAIVDRIGHAGCSVLLWPALQRGMFGS